MPQGLLEQNLLFGVGVPVGDWVVFYVVWWWFELHLAGLFLDGSRSYQTSLVNRQAFFREHTGSCSLNGPQDARGDPRGKLRKSVDVNEFVINMSNPCNFEKT